MLIVCSSHSALSRHTHQHRQKWLQDSSHHIASEIMHAPLRTICWRLKFASLGVLLTDRMVCPAISSIVGMLILAPLLVSPGVTHTPSKIAARSHRPITVCTAVCTLPVVVSLCGLHPHIHEIRLQVFSVNSPCSEVKIAFIIARKEIM